MYTVDLNLCRAVREDDGSVLRYEYLNNTWDMDSLLRHLQRMSLVRPTHAFFISGKCVQPGVLTPEEIEDCEKIWK